MIVIVYERATYLNVYVALSYLVFFFYAVSARR